MKKILQTLLLLLIGIRGFSQLQDTLLREPDTLSVGLDSGAVVAVTIDTLVDVLTDAVNEKSNIYNTLNSPDIVAGRTAGGLDVSLTGAATYTLPITIPPGINGVQPQIALIYNSQAGNSIAGYGWSIAGLSSITRVPSTLYHDNKTGGIAFNSDDRFALDGQRLLLKSGVYGADGAEYQTEVYSNVRIISRGVSPYGAAYGPEYFEVFYPDGTKAYYGYTANSRTRVDFAISYSENPNGNRINYTYQESDNSLTVTQVGYGSPGILSSINHIDFVYTTASRREQMFIGGENFYRHLLLNKIVVSGNGTVLRNYHLTHDDSGVALGYQRLLSVQEYNGDETEAYTQVDFGYNTTNNNTAIGLLNVTGLSVTGIQGSNSKVVTADFTGNGMMDFIVYPDTKDKLWPFWDPEINSGYPQFASTYNSGVFKEVLPINWLTADSKHKSQGFVLVKQPVYNTITFHVMSAYSVAGINQAYEKTWDNVPVKTGNPDCYGDPPPNGIIERDFLSGDFNGDGLLDVIAVSKPYSYINYLRKRGCTPVGSPECCTIQYMTENTADVHFINLDRRITGNFVFNAGALASSNIGRLYTGDFNGDGKTDILQIKAGEMYVYSLNTSNNTIYLLWQLNDPDIKLQYSILPGDYNGDGKTDIIFGTANNSNYFVNYFSNGTAFVKHSKSQPFAYNENQWDGTQGIVTMNEYYLIPSDVNGDGKTDMLYMHTTTKNGMTQGTLSLSVWHNANSYNNSGDLSFTSGGTKTIGANIVHHPIPVFINHERYNSKLEFGVVSNNSITAFTLEKDLRKDVQLKSITNNGVVFEIDYVNLGSNPSYPSIQVYEHGTEEIFPYADIERSSGLSVVNRLKRIVSGQTLQSVFAYKKGISHLQGLGFMGFSETIRSNWHQEGVDPNRIYITNVYNPHLKGALLQSFSTKTPGITPAIKQTPVTVNTGNNTATVNDGALLSDYITREDNVYNTQQLPNKVLIVVPEYKVKKDLLTGIEASGYFEYDNFYSFIKNVNVAGGFRNTTEITYSNNTGNIDYHIGRPLTKKTTADNGVDIFTTEEEYDYLGGHLPKEITRKGNGTTPVTEELEYDIFGNVTESALVTADGTRTSSNTYDVSGRFIASQTDIDGMTTSYTYDQSTGNVLTVTNPYNQTKSYSYNSWGRLVETTNYLGKKTFHSYTKSGTDTHIEESDEEGNERLKIVNTLGQTIQTGGKDITGQWIYKSLEYDIYGRKNKESEPYTGSPTQWNETEYDEYGRISQILNYTGQSTNISYMGLSTTVNNGTKSVTTTKNALGQTVSIQDPGGTIAYTYDAAGNLETANYDGLVQSIAYDGWGRKTQLTDPSAGTYNYEYNDFGELTKEITPKGTTTYSYDAAGKLTSKTLTGDETNMAWVYTYNGTTKLLEQLELTNADGNNATYTYTYDSYKRPGSVTENNLHAIFTKSFSYDSFGRVVTETSQAQDKASSRSASRTLEYYYQNGGLLKVTDQVTGQRIHEVSSLNARGQVTTALMGNTLSQSDSYDSYGLPQNFVTQKQGSTTTDLLDLGYSFNAQRGLLNSRSNSVFNWNETFTYDNLDRLTAFNDNDGNNSHSYDSRGRITNNSQLGDYVYNPNNYQQDELINLTAGAINWYQDRNLQEITYNAFKSPVEIKEEDKEIISFRYNAAMQRAHMYYGDTITNAEDRRYRRHYSEDGSMEITNDTQTGTTSFVFYLGGDAYSAPAIWKEVHTTAQTTQQMYFLHRDHLGSIVLITDDAGNIAEKRAFDAWGNIVKLEDGNGNPLTAFVILDRGYTGHEHLLGVALIHMNGRLYDPKLHRFLSPDNYVQDPFNTQNFNRYGYVLNNPLSHIDPSGELAWLIPVLIIGIKAAVVGAAIAAVGYTASIAFSDGGFNNWNWGDFGKSVGIGAISGVATAGIGVVFGHTMGTFLNEAGRGLAHGLVNGGISEFTGGDFMSGFLSGGLGSLAGSGFQAWLPDIAGSGLGTIGFSAVAGGVGAELTGDNFWRGAATGATVATLNHLGGKVLGGDPTKKALDDLKATSEAVGFTADGAEVFMATYEGKAIYYTNINGKIKWISTAQISSVISKVGKVGLYGGLFTDALGFVSGIKSGIETVMSMSWAGSTALLNLGIKGNVFSGLLYTTLFTDFAQPAKPIYYRAPFGIPDNTRVKK